MYVVVEVRKVVVVLAVVKKYLRSPIILTSNEIQMPNNNLITKLHLQINPIRKKNQEKPKKKDDRNLIANPKLQTQSQNQSSPEFQPPFFPVAPACLHPNET